MFEPERDHALLSPSDVAMDQQQKQRSMRMSHALADPGQLNWLNAENLGRERLRLLLAEWLKRNGWSLAVVSRLAELSLLAGSKTPVPDWVAGMPLQSGALVNHRGHVWQADGEPSIEPLEGAPGWIDQGLSSRLHASGLNLYLRNRKSSLTVSFLLEMGRLNEWIARVQEGRATAPNDPRLNQMVMSATVIRDADGPYGPEDLLSIAGDRLPPPPWPDQSSSTDAAGIVSGRQLRAAAAAAGLDIIDDWPRIADLYPSDDTKRLERLHQVLRGDAQWGSAEAEDEQVAAVLLLQRLQQMALQTAKPNLGITGDEG